MVPSRAGSSPAEQGFAGVGVSLSRGGDAECQRRVRAAPRAGVLSAAAGVVQEDVASVGRMCGCGSCGCRVGHVYF